VRLLRRGESASTLDALVAGLGNPGREYERTRHNVGWLVVDELARRHGGSFRSKFSGRLAEVRAADLRLALLKPETYMNDSGRSLAPAVRFFKLNPAALVVVHDDVDLEEVRLQVRLGGGLAGHNGLRSIAAQLGTPDFGRVRVGVGRPGRGDPRPVADYVLSPFAPETDLDALVTRAADAAETLVAEVGDGSITEYEITPEGLGLSRHTPDGLLGGDAHLNARVLRGVLSGEERGAARDVVLANAGAAIYVSGGSESLESGVRLAEESIETGAAGQVLEDFVKTTRRLSGEA